MKVSHDLPALPFIKQEQLPSVVGEYSSSLFKTHQQDRALPVDDKELENLVNRANKTLNDLDTEVKVSFHEGTNQMMIKVVNSKTHEVLKEIPPEKLIDLVYNLCELAGLFTDRRI
ncbi:flagellar protein FlaG [Paenibacillus lautus]|uniref:flagellar protein FlaG n=1 Tax=Paenibacillus TaxID=44249 RepID=UPI001787EB20|nr:MULTISPECIES: flagellar protein FlaG [Paenibacillus]MEC0310740.1 flagellar protein FlaG [Paenibacillus lautus]QOT09820.1 flagellar protein FlaG [Paenibacillus sp. JNUCC-32]